MGTLTETAQPRERPILFSAPMVRALLEGRKTQTRRAVKPQLMFDGKDAIVARYPNQHGCPYGQPGDRLWVRETCRAEELECDGLDGVRYIADGNFRSIENTRDAADAWMALAAYRGGKCATVPPIHMPRWVSRITLELTDVRVERLHEISEEDAEAEGTIMDDIGGLTYRDGYREIWESINGPNSWGANPWVWVLEFRRIVA